MTRRELRIKRFWTFAANLALYTEHKGVFLCPFCQSLFEVEGVDRVTTNFLVGAHIVPFTVSHTMRTTMSCFTCDNWFGTWFNSHESRRQAIRRVRSLGKTQKLYTRMADKGVEFGVSTFLTWNNPDRPTIDIKHVVELDEDRKVWFKDYVERTIMRPSWDGTELGLDYYGRYSNRRADLSYWHSVYLHMFHHYGYEWAMSSHGNLIKRQFQMAEFPVIPERFIEPLLIHPSLLSEYVLRRRQPSTHVDPTQDGFFVVFPHVKPMDGHVAVFVPRDWDGPGPKMPEFLLEDVTPDHKSLAFNKHPLPFSR